MIVRSALVLLLWASAWGTGTGFTGSAVCGSCHAAQARSQSASGHAHALSRAAGHPLAKSFFRDSPKTRAPGFRFDFLPGPSVRISGGGSAVDAVIEWAFGAGEQAVTFVSRVDSAHYIEHYFSYYRALDALGPTPGQQDLHPAGLGEAAGLYYKTRDPDTGIDGCFACHSTGPLRFTSDNTIEPYEEGVHCEACHGPGAAHVEAAAAHKPAARLIGNPARLNAVEQLRFCGTCHRPPESKGNPADLTFPWNVRHQPVYLARSACFRGAKGSLTCLTCHAPHQPLDRAAQTYNQQCVRCHPQRAAFCSSNCVDCHMPRVSPLAPLRFTNHWIGIYDSAAKLVPRR